MKICAECGFENKDDSIFCINCGATLPKSHHIQEEETGSRQAKYQSETVQTLVIGDLGERFVAYIIDSIFISIFMGIFFSKSFFLWFSANNTLLFLYFTVSEYLFNTTVGKYIMELEVVSIEGQEPEIIPIILNAVGKSYFLVIDLILGWIFVPTNGDEGRRTYGVSLNQRLTQYLGELVVIKSSKERLARKFHRTKEKL